MLKKLLWLIVLLLIAGGAVFGAMYMRINQPYRGYDAAEQFVDIPQGAGSRAIGDRLIEAGVMRDAATYRTALWMSGEGRRLKAGEYRFDRPMTPFEVIDKLARGDVYVVNLTLPEGLTIAEMAKLFESHGLGPAKAFVSAASDATLVRDLDPAARDLEGYVFPDTYALPRKTTAAQLMKLAVERFERVFTSAGGVGVCEPAAHRHAAAVRSDGDLRPGSRRQIQRQHPPRRSCVRFALQHVQVSRTSARTDRVAGPRSAGGGGSPRGHRVSVFRLAQRRIARVREDARRTQSQRAEVSGAVLPGATVGWVRWVRRVEWV